MNAEECIFRIDYTVDGELSWCNPFPWYHVEDHVKKTSINIELITLWCLLRWTHNSLGLRRSATPLGDTEILIIGVGRPHSYLQPGTKWNYHTIYSLEDQSLKVLGCLLEKTTDLKIGYRAV